MSETHVSTRGETRREENGGGGSGSGGGGDTGRGRAAAAAARWRADRQRQHNVAFAAAATADVTHTRAQKRQQQKCQATRSDGTKSGAQREWQSRVDNPDGACVWRASATLRPPTAYRTPLICKIFLRAA
jgi:hypothetical protein